MEQGLLDRGLIMTILTLVDFSPFMPLSLLNRWTVVGDHRDRRRVSPTLFYDIIFLRYKLLTTNGGSLNGI